MKETLQNAKMLRYAASELLREWKLRKGYTVGRTDCAAVRDDGIDLDSLLMAEIKMRYDRLLREAPADMVPVGDISDDCRVAVRPDLSVEIILPEDCVRVLELKMPSWKTSVTEFVAPDSGIALRQRSEWLRGRSENPVCIAKHRCIDAYSVGSRSETLPEKMLAVCRPLSSAYLFSESAWQYLLNP